MLYNSNKSSALLNCRKSELLSMNRLTPGCEKSTSKFQEVPPTPTLEMKNVEIKELAFHVRFHFLICVVSFMRRGSCKSGHRQYHNKKHNLKTEVSKSLEVNLLLLFSSQQVRKKKLLGNKEQRFTRTTPNLKFPDCPRDRRRHKQPQGLQPTKHFFSCRWIQSL